MIISVASGKGGTGKTTVASSLASVWKKPVMAADLDVEEPNLHLFIKPVISHRKKAFLGVPLADEAKCTLCRMCSDLCQFKAINVLGSNLITFPEMCHSCGGCVAVCPEGALSWGKRELGEIVTGTSGNISFIMGRLRVGEAMSPPLMNMVKQEICQVMKQGSIDVIVDSPPGVSCPAVCAVMDSDLIVLVTEPTPFGFHDFKLAWEAFSPLKKPVVVVINRSGLGDGRVYEFCRDKRLPVISSIPFNDDIAKAYSKGQLVSGLNPGLRRIFSDLARAVQEYRPEGIHA
ncbi:4Fe-4S binding protein [Desulfonatronovibrio hydrogenovorans]|uniref:nucleotide-binding protein n=1 Tax=Desulfonatronovibrio hydrogenovorans TaxID=53245 RepID=UPI00048C2B04|nr:ATP-binding protein [Desulfonatronovibrio hydrogenovorans]